MGLNEIYHEKLNLRCFIINPPFSPPSVISLSIFGARSSKGKPSKPNPLFVSRENPTFKFYFFNSFVLLLIINEKLLIFLKINVLRSFRFKRMVKDFFESACEILYFVMVENLKLIYFF